MTARVARTAEALVKGAAAVLLKVPTKSSMFTCRYSCRGAKKCCCRRLAIAPAFCPASSLQLSRTREAAISTPCSVLVHSWLLIGDVCSARTASTVYRYCWLCADNNSPRRRDRWLRFSPQVLFSFSRLPGCHRKNWCSSACDFSVGGMRYAGFRHERQPVCRRLL